MKGVRRRGAIAALLAVLAWPVFVGTARADDVLPVGPNPILNVQLASGALTVRTWDRQAISIATQGTLSVEHLDPARVDPRLHRGMNIWSQTVDGPKGEVRLPAETFELPPFSGRTHDAVVARGRGDTIVYVPQATALVVAHLDNGTFRLERYTGVFVAHVRTGRIALDHVSGTGFAEVLNGPVVATDSTFARLRVRTAFGNMYFRGCTSHQIQATSSFGSIVYDNGKFKPGLAHFSSEHGSVALGVRGNSRVQIGAHTSSGKIVSNLHAPASVRGNAAGTPEHFSAGAPIVTTNTKDGSIYLYNGSIRSNPAVRRQLIQARALPMQHVPSPHVEPRQPPHRATPPHAAPHAAPPARPPHPKPPESRLQ